MPLKASFRVFLCAALKLCTGARVDLASLGTVDSKKVHRVRHEVRKAEVQYDMHPEVFTGWAAKILPAGLPLRLCLAV